MLRYIKDTVYYRIV